MYEFWVCIILNLDFKVLKNSKPKDENTYLQAKLSNCASLMSTNIYSARVEISMWNWLSGWPRLSGLERAAVPLWHINLYGQLTAQRRSQALSSHTAPSPWDSAAWHVLFFCTPSWNYDPEKCPTGIRSWQTQRPAGIFKSVLFCFLFASVALKATGTRSWFSLLVWTQINCNYPKRVF